MGAFPVPDNAPRRHLAQCAEIARAAGDRSRQEEVPVAGCRHVCALLFTLHTHSARWCSLGVRSQPVGVWPTNSHSRRSLRRRPYLVVVAPLAPA